MASNTYGAIKLSTAEDVGAVLKKKTGSADGYKPKEWADTINLMGLLPIRTASGTIAHFDDGADDVPLKSLTAQILPIQEGTGDPSPSNPRPISGTSVLNVEQRGKNLFDEANATLSNLSLSNHIFTNTITDTRASLQFQAVLLDDNLQTIQSLFSQSVTATGAFSRTVTITNSGYSKLMIKHNGSTRDLRIIVPFTYPKETVTISANFLGVDVQTVGGLSFENLQIEVGSTATNYEPYKDETYTVALGRTVYGGNADFVEGEGEVTHGVVDLGDLTWTYRTDVLSVPCFLSSDISDIKSGTLPLACSYFKIMSPNRTAINGNYQVSIGNNTNAKYLVIRYDEYTDGTAVKTALIGQKLVYELATPTDFTFEGEEINSYLGVNNLWADTGDTAVEYRADIDLLIAELGG